MYAKLAERQTYVRLPCIAAGAQAAGNQPTGRASVVAFSTNGLQLEAARHPDTHFEALILVARCQLQTGLLTLHDRDNMKLCTLATEQGWHAAAPKKLICHC